MENRDNTLDTLDNLIPKLKHLVASLTNKSKTENTITIVEMGSAWDTAGGAPTSKQIVPERVKIILSKEHVKQNFATEITA